MRSGSFRRQLAIETSWLLGVTRSKPAVKPAWGLHDVGGGGALEARQYASHMSVLTRIRRLFDGPAEVHECRRCGTTLDRDDDRCHNCGTEDVVSYRIE